MTYISEAEITSLIRSFEDASIARGEWRHAEHLVVALYYIEHNDPKTALEMMRKGLLNLLVNGFGVDLAKEMPYHETLTGFWMRVVADFSASRNGALIDKANELVAVYDKDYPLKFYSRACLFSDEARCTFVAGDLQELFPI